MRTIRCLRSRRTAAGLARRLIAGSAFLLLGCNLELVETDSFATGRVLRPSENELELHTNAGYDAGAGTFARGLPGGYEIRGGITYNDAYADYNRIYGAELDLSRSLFRTPGVEAAATLSAGAFASESLPTEFSGVHGSMTCAFGCSPASWLTVFAPLRMSYQYASHGFQGFAFVPGLGVRAQSGHLFLAAVTGYALPVPDWSLYLAARLQTPSFQIGYRW